MSPPPAPPVISASADDLAKAHQLQVQIESESAAVDVLADRYNKARDTVTAAMQQLQAVQAELSGSQQDVAVSVQSASSAQGALKAAAVQAYLGVASIQTGGGQPTTADQRRRAVAYQRGVNGLLANNLRQLHSAESQLAALTQHVEERLTEAAGDSVALSAAQDAADSAVRAVNDQQAQLASTISLVSGNMVGLVAAVQAQANTSTYDLLSHTNSLDFTPIIPVPLPVPTAAAAVQLALAQTGKPYVWGGNGPNVFDCSGLIQWTWAQLGNRVPRVAADQQAWAIPVPISQLQPGDLVFFGRPAHHVGMYVGNGLMVDAPHTGAYVNVVPIWWNELAGFGRVHF